jgi:RNA polymerase sigma-70 factor, ECF subfamily
VLPLPFRSRSFHWPAGGQAEAKDIHDPELDALKAGDEAAFQSLIHHYHGPMLRLAMTYVADRGAAEDVVQESWLTCLRSLDRFEGRSSLKTWIFGIVINVARARRRKEARIVPFASFWRRDDSDSRRPTVDRLRFGSDGMWRAGPHSWDNIPESRVIGGETLQKVKAAIESLPPKQREVILLRDVAGFEAVEVSSLLGISAANERVRLHRARAAVRKMLEEYLG